ISRCLVCASQRFVPLLSTRRQYAPSLTLASPAAGAVNEAIHGKLRPSSKVLALSRLPPGGGGTLPAPTGGVAAGALPLEALQLVAATAATARSKDVRRVRGRDWRIDSPYRVSLTECRWLLS